jgi:hypothetical protein
MPGQYGGRKSRRSKKGKRYGGSARRRSQDSCPSRGPMADYTEHYIAPRVRVAGWSLMDWLPGSLGRKKPAAPASNPTSAPAASLNAAGRAAGCPCGGPLAKHDDEHEYRGGVVAPYPPMRETDVMFGGNDVYGGGRRGFSRGFGSGFGSGLGYAVGRSIMGGPSYYYAPSYYRDYDYSPPPRQCWDRWLRRYVPC